MKQPDLTEPIRKELVFWQTIRTEYDRARLRLAARLHRWAERTTADVRGRRGRDFIGPELDELDKSAAGRRDRVRRRLAGEL